MRAAAVRRLNLDRLCDMAGTTWLLKRDRQHADRTRGERLTDLRERHQQEEQTSASAAPPFRPVSRECAAKHIAEALRILDTG